MKCIEVVLFSTCAACLAQVPDLLQVKDNKDDDRWIWGFVEERNDINNKTDDRNQEQQSTSPSTTLAPVDDPCSYHIPPKPSFSAPGRKITDEKCEEYKWNKLVTEESHRKRSECFKKLNEGKPLRPVTIGGRLTVLGEFPQMGAIGWKAVSEGYIFKCGSTLISSKFILTAAHCSKASPLDTTLADVIPKIVRLNDKNLFQKDDKGYYVTHDMNITRIIVHPDYKPPKKYFDIALMELEREVTFTWLMQPACLWTKPEVDELGQQATLTGWGVLHSGSVDISPELQAGVVKIVNNSYCDQLLHSSRNRNWWGLQEHQLCAGNLAGGVDACQGDSGGQLQVRQHIPGSVKEYIYHITGVTSFGIGCALPKHPGIYTRVSSFVDWIEGYVWPEG